MPHSENCRHLLESLSDYINDELQAELCLALEEHLAECENCRIVVDTLRKTVYLYHTSAPKPEMPQDVRQRLFQRLDLSDFID
jgi:predicted anti-sigma-YlaC factor YlaD